MREIKDQKNARRGNETINDLFRSYKKIIAVVVLLLSGILFWFFGCHKMAQKEEEKDLWVQVADDVQSYDFRTQHLTGSITFGTEGHLSADRAQPVVMRATGNGEPFEGTVKITLPGEEGKGVAYQAAVRCNDTYGSKIVLSVPRLGNVSFFSVEILDQYGTEELARMIVGASGIVHDSVDGTEKKKILIGVLTDEPDRLSWLWELKDSLAEEDRIYVFSRIDEKILWGGAKELESLSGILIDGYDTGKLRYKQKNNLREWVQRKGGGLLLGTGAKAGEVLGGITGLAAAAPGKESVESLQFYSEEESAGYLSVVTNEVAFKDRSAWKTQRISFPVSCCKRRLGHGNVMLLTWSLGDPAFTQWTGREQMVSELFSCFIPKIMTPDSVDEDSAWYLKKVLYSCLESQSPNTLYYALFFIVYLAVLAFFAYYILRRIRKREYIWLLVPLISIAFTVCLFIRTAGFGSSIASTYSAIEVLDPSAETDDIYMLYQNNEGEGSSVDLVPEVVSAGPMDFTYRDGEEDVASLHRLKQDYTINNTRNGYDIVFEETVPGTSRLMQMMKNPLNRDHSEWFKAELEAGYTSFSGTVTNISPWHFTRVIVVRGNQYRILADVRAGETRAIGSDEVGCWSGFDEENTVYTQEEENYAASGLLDYIRYRYIGGEQDFNTVIIAGITEGKKPSLLKDQETLKNHLTICVGRVALPFDKNLHYISDINKECLCSDTAGQFSLLHDTLEEKKTKVVYQFDRDKSVWCAARNRDSFEGTIYAYNYQTGRDDVVFEKKDGVMNGQELEPYLSEMNKMTLTFKMKQDDEYGPAPVLTFVLRDEEKR